MQIPRCCRRKPLLVAALLLAASCAAPIREFYPDMFMPEDRVYVNKALGFSLTFSGNWDIVTDPNKMTRTGRRFARSFQNTGGEVLFIGATVEATQGTRGMAMNLNLSDWDHAQKVRDINRKTLYGDSGLVDVVIGNNGFVKWEYCKDGYRFVEYFFTAETYNIRIAFWSKPGLFERFRPVYEEIMASLTWVGHF